MKNTVKFDSKLPHVGTTIFTVMSALATQHKAINLSQGFPNFDCSPRLKNLVTRYMNEGYNQYPPMAGVMKLREQIAIKVENMYGAIVNPDTEITVVAGGTQGLFTAISAFIRPKDEVIIIEPAYDSYRPSIEVCGGVPVIYELEAPTYAIDWQKMTTLVTPKTKMIIINTPHNPTGTTLKEKDLKALEQLTKDTNILVLSDEVYEHLIYDGKEHQSVLRFPELLKRSLAVYSFGKTFHNTGWKVGYVVAPEYLMQEFRKVHQFNVFTVNTPVQHGLADFLQTPEEYLSLPGFYQQKRDFFTNILEQSPFKPIRSEGTFFQLAEYGHLSQEADTAFAKRMTIEHGVAVIPISVFYSDGRDEKVIRFCFAKTEQMLADAGKLLVKI